MIENKSGLKWELIKVGNGEKPQPGQKVSVHYDIWFGRGTTTSNFNYDKNEYVDVLHDSTNDEKDPFSGRESQKDIYDSDKVQKRHRSFGKREFKGKSPLATSKAYTAIAREGILNQLKKKFPKSNNSLLSEDNIIKE